MRVPLQGVGSGTARNNMLHVPVAVNNLIRVFFAPCLSRSPLLPQRTPSPSAGPRYNRYAPLHLCTSHIAILLHSRCLGCADAAFVAGGSVCIQALTQSGWDPDTSLSALLLTVR